MKKLLLLIAVMLFAITLASCGNQTNNGTTTEGVLVVGMECDYAPFNWTETTASATNVPIANVDGAYAEGYDVQMAKLVAQALGLQLQVKAIEWDGLIPALKAGDIDMIIAGMSPTDERKLSIDFSDAYYVSEEVMLVSATGNYTNATSLNDFSGARVAGQLGTIYADLVPQVTACGAIAGTDLATVPLLVNAIKGGDIDATIVELPVAVGLCAADSSLTYRQMTTGTTFNVAAEDITVSVGVRKGFSYLSAINTALAGISETQRNALMTAAVAANA